MLLLPRLIIISELCAVEEQAKAREKLCLAISRALDWKSGTVLDGSGRLAVLVVLDCWYPMEALRSIYKRETYGGNSA